MLARFARCALPQSPALPIFGVQRTRPEAWQSLPPETGFRGKRTPLVRFLTSAVNRILADSGRLSAPGHIAFYPLPAPGSLAARPDLALTVVMVCARFTTGGPGIDLFT